jgi:NAD(P)-dependent dehydrogenase (short-subunit alcohol dehydrogenase family)
VSETATATLFGLTGQAAIVTGASGGLGRMMARGLAAAGCHLVVTARRGDELRRLEGELLDAPGRVVVAPADVRDPEHARMLVETTLTAHGRLDGVILNAGTSRLGPAEDEDLDAFSEVLEVNVTAQMRLAREAAGAMIAAEHGGWMILMSSILGRRSGTGPGVAAYTASKGAIEQLTRELARQWAPHGIRVNALAPGFFPTAMNAPMVADRGRRRALEARIPLGRAGGPADLIGAVIFLASPAGAYVTGHSLALDGGMTCW